MIERNRRKSPVFAAFWIGLSVLSMVTAAPAATYYVARGEAGASDARDGLAPTASGDGRGPWLTIRKAVDSAQPGDTIFVGSGRYCEEVFIKTPRIRLRALDGARPLIDGENVRPYGVRNPDAAAAQEVSIEGFEIAHHTVAGVMIAGRSSKGVTIRGNIIHHARDKGITVRGTGHRLEGNIVFMIGNNQEAMGIHLAAASDCVVQDNDVFLCKKTAIRDQSGRWNTIQGNLMHQCWTGLDYNACSGARAFNNCIYDNSQGFNPKHVKGDAGWNLFWHNTIYDSHGPHISIAVNRADNSEGPGPDCDYLDIRNNVLVKAGHTHIWNKPDIVGEHLVIDGNLYFGPPGRPSFFYHVDWPSGGKPGLTTLEEMRRRTPFAAHDRFADPRLIAPDAGNLDYPDTSPAAAGGARLDSPFGTQLGAQGVRRPATRFIPVTLKAIAASANESLMDRTTDRRYHTAWHSGTETANQWVTYQVQDGAAFTHLILVPTAHKVESNVRRYEFSVSDDNRTYRRIRAGENNDSGSWFLYEFDKPIAAKFLKFTMLDKFSDDGYTWTLNRLEFDELRAGRFDPPLPDLVGEPGSSAARGGAALRVHPANPRYFTDGSKNPDGSLKAVYLTGSHTWHNLQDGGPTDPPAAFDYDGFLDFLVAQNHNFFRLWAWESPREAAWHKGTLYCEPLPFLRTGPGKGVDGKPRFDVTKFNPEYFKRLRERVQAAQKRGLYVGVMLFQGFSVAKKARRAQSNPWPGHPFHRDNNINGIDGDLNGDGNGYETHTLDNPRVTAIHEAYVRQVIDTVGPFDNVIYEISNESHGGSTAWQYHMIDLIRQYEKQRRWQHPIWMSFQWDDTDGAGTNQALFDSPAEAVSPRHGSGAREAYRTDPPVADGSKVILLDTDHLWGEGGDAAWVWKSFLRGHQPIYMDRIAKLTGDQRGDIPGAEGVRRAMGVTRRLAQRVNLAALTPHPEIASTTYCLAHPGKEYVVYLPEGGEVTVDLSAAPGLVAVEWLDPSSGETTQGQGISGGVKRPFQPPFPGGAVLYLRAVEPRRDTPTGGPLASSVLAQAARGVEKYRKGDATIRIVREGGAEAAGVRVEIAQRTHDFAFGNVFRPRHYRNEAYRTRFLELFNLIQLLEFNWGQYETEEGKPKLADRREFIDGWCREHGLTRFYGHMLVWSPQNSSPDRPNIPHWLFHYDRPTQDRLLKERIEREVRAYRDVDILWDVVNEAVHCRRWGDWEKKGYMDEPIPDVVPYVCDAFRWAHEANPQARLLLNDYRVIPQNKYRDRYVELIDRLQKDKTAVHAIGIQAHDPYKGAYWFSPQEIWQTCERFGTQTGLPVHFTEFCYLSDPTQEIRGTYRQGKWDPHQQAEAIEEFYRVTFGHPAVASIIYFGLGDDDPPWLPNLCLLDKSFQPKPAWDRLKKLIKEEWNTRQSGPTDPTGVYRFRGFFGQYDVRVADGAKQQAFTAHLEKDKANVWRFTLDKQP